MQLDKIRQKQKVISLSLKKVQLEKKQLMARINELILAQLSLEHSFEKIIIELENLNKVSSFESGIQMCPRMLLAGQQNYSNAHERYIKLQTAISESKTEIELENKNLNNTLGQEAHFKRLLERLSQEKSRCLQQRDMKVTMELVNTARREVI